MPDIEEQLQDQFRLLRQRLDMSAPDPARVFSTDRRRRWRPSRLLLAISGTVLALGGSAGLAVALTGSHPSSKPVPVATTPSSAPAAPRRGLLLRRQRPSRRKARLASLRTARLRGDPAYATRAPSPCRS